MDNNDTQRKPSYNFEEHECVFKKEIKKYVCDNCFRDNLDQRRFESAPSVGADSNFMGNSLEDSKPLGRFGIFNGINKTSNCKCKSIEVETCYECEKLKKTKYAMICDMDNIIYLLKETCKSDMNHEKNEHDYITHDEIFDEIKCLVSIVERIEGILHNQKEKYIPLKN